MLDVDERAVVWRAFEVLADALTSRPGQPTYLNESSFRAKALKWGQMFRKATFDEVQYNAITLFTHDYN